MRLHTYIIRVLALIAIVLVLFASCEFTIYDNGSLDGYWRLSQVDTLSTGGIVNMKSNKVFWAVQKQLITVTKIESDTKILFYFNSTSDSLTLYNPYISKRMEGDIKVTNHLELAPYGINQLTEKYAVEVLNSNNMVLRSNQLRLHFDKY